MKNRQVFFLLAGFLVLLFIFYTLWYTKNDTLQSSTTSKTVELKDGDEYDLAASYVKKDIGGISQKMLAYNGSIPGPTIKVKQGSTVTINFKNNTDTNQLLHSHGIRLENKYDGSQLVQSELKPGESFKYKIRFDDYGVFWYHPHAEEVYTQVLGLYGAFLVTPKEQSLSAKVDSEEVIFLSDLPFKDGKIDISRGDQSFVLMGHYGDLAFINGSENYTATASLGEVKRLYVINSANARPFRFAIKNTKLKVVGSDNGYYEKEFFADSITLGPSERAIVDVLFEKEGTFDILNDTPQNKYIIGKLLVQKKNTEASRAYASEFQSLSTYPTTTQSIESFRGFFDKKAEKQLTLSINFTGSMMNMQGSMMHKMPDGTMMSNMMMNGDGIEWDETMSMMNSRSTANNTKWKIIDEQTKLENKNINWSLEANKPIKVQIFNDSNTPHPMQHPIHFHGIRFLVISKNGLAEKNLVWKDTILVKAGETAELLLDPSNKGIWMAHCHISEHLADGMMFHFDIK